MKVRRASRALSIALMISGLCCIAAVETPAPHPAISGSRESGRPWLCGFARVWPLDSGWAGACRVGKGRDDFDLGIVAASVANTIATGASPRHHLDCEQRVLRPRDVFDALPGPRLTRLAFPYRPDGYRERTSPAVRSRPVGRESETDRRLLNASFAGDQYEAGANELGYRPGLDEMCSVNSSIQILSAEKNRSAGTPSSICLGAWTRCIDEQHLVAPIFVRDSI